MESGLFCNYIRKVPNPRIPATDGFRNVITIFPSEPFTSDYETSRPRRA